MKDDYQNLQPQQRFMQGQEVHQYNIHIFI